MIGYVRGTLQAREAGRVLVETPGGLGLEISMSASTMARLPEVGQPVKLLTSLLIREDHWQLVGFLAQEEREAFLSVLNVTGVGPKVALAVIGQLGVAGLQKAVLEGAWKQLRTVPGVGPRLAQRLVVELKGTFLAEDDIETVPAVLSETSDEVREGLLALGYSDAEASRALEGLTESDPAKRLREALRRLDMGRGSSRG